MGVLIDVLASGFRGLIVQGLEFGVQGLWVVVWAKP